jgi:F0F1-type ATP synthase membrane subunit c/vacuolar-type H+-ATPase subunit K
MDPVAAKYIGAGIAMFAALGVGLGLGNIFSSYINATSRNPSAEPKFKTMTFIGFAATELVLILCFVIAIVMLQS